VSRTLTFQVNCFAESLVGARELGHALGEVGLRGDRVPPVTASVLWPVSFIPTERGSPALSKFRTAVLLRSSMMRPETLAVLQASRQRL
jgi:hypothetical protein